MQLITITARCRERNRSSAAPMRAEFSLSVTCITNTISASPRSASTCSHCAPSNGSVQLWAAMRRPRRYRALISRSAARSGASRLEPT